jgi:hypothetical protein
VNPAAVAADLHEIDQALLSLLVKLDALKGKLPPGTPPAVAVGHALDTVALLSEGMEQMVTSFLNADPTNPSWN